MASDIPSGGFTGSVAMARALVTYIDCPRRVRAAILENFLKAPSLAEISRMRAEHLAPKPKPEAIRSNDGYYPRDAAHALNETNRQFLWRLSQERLSSARRLEIAERRGVVA